MGLPAKLTSNQLSDLVNGATDVGVANNAVTYDAAGRLTALRMPAGGSLWQTRSYFNWTATNATYPGTGNGRLDEIHIGTTSSNWDRLRLEYDYDSYGNVKRLTENGTANSFTYNTQNRAQWAPDRSLQQGLCQ